MRQPGRFADFRDADAIKRRAPEQAAQPPHQRRPVFPAAFSFRDFHALLRCGT